jgi:transposase, IS5 family
MLRLYVVQPWSGLADEALDDAVYDSQARRHVIGIDLGVEAVADAATLLTFRRLLEEHALTAVILATVNAELSARGLLLKEGTLVDATILQAPASTKNRAKARDAAMHSTRNGNQGFFGTKAHIGADADADADADVGLVHTVVGTAANVADVTQTSDLLHGEEKTLDAELKASIERCERLRAQVRARVEHPFHTLKNRFSYRKVRYTGLEKNTAQLRTLFALANLVIAKSALLAAKQREQTAIPCGA